MVWTVAAAETMKTFTALLVCLVLGVCIEYTQSSPARAIAAVGKDLVLSKKFKATIIGTDGLRRHTQLKLKKALEKVYRRQDTDITLATKFANEAYKILKTSFEVDVDRKKIEVPPYDKFYIEFKIDNRYVLAWK